LRPRLEPTPVKPLTACNYGFAPSLAYKYWTRFEVIGAFAIKMSDDGSIRTLKQSRVKALEFQSIGASEHGSITALEHRDIEHWGLESWGFEHWGVRVLGHQSIGASEHWGIEH
jgi:hypothetical protein